LNVDAARSTSDSVFVMTSMRRAVDVHHFAVALASVLTELVQLIARDGLGARRGLWIDVEGARSRAQAERVGRAIALYAHLKYAVYDNPHLIAGSAWAAVGSMAGRDVVEDQLGIDVNGVTIFRGEVLLASADSLILPPGRDVTIRVDLVQGSARTQWFTCDGPKPQPAHRAADAEHRMGQYPPSRNR
jgi:glutamate N-acetyltransferase/amino-acid N-acetyltransferase